MVNILPLNGSKVTVTPEMPLKITSADESSGRPEYLGWVQAAH